jgi:hypothetical protein
MEEPVKEAGIQALRSPLAAAFAAAQRLRKRLFLRL